VNTQSANTDGICMIYPPKVREEVLTTIKANAMMTGFEYEETPYKAIAFKDVNNYVAVTADAEATIITPDGSIQRYQAKGGKAKRKGLYASNDPAENPLYLMKNPTMEVCSNLAVNYLTHGIHPRDGIKSIITNLSDFTAIRNVKGGGIQRERTEAVDDWVLVKDVGTKDNEWESPSTGKKAKRKSKPAPLEVGVGGTPLGRVVRWYMSKDKLPPITYIGSGNTVPKTEGAKACMTLPSELPTDLDVDWYVAEALSILKTIGVDISVESV
jgi:hypothetical protein